MIEAIAVTYEYPGTRALEHISFSLPPRSITALVGPNGAGKTTLLRCLAGLDEPFSGAIRIAGIDVTQDRRAAHRQIGYLPDHFGLYAELSVQQALRYAGRSRGLDATGLEQRLETVIRQVGLADKLGGRVGALSRGQRQRLALAQAIIHSPAVLLLDEPASGLDPESRAALSSLMRSLAGEGMTLVVSSHILAELEEYCTGMLVLQQGRVVEHRRLEQVARGRHIRIRLAQPSASVDEALAQLAGAMPLQGSDLERQFSFAGDDAELAGLLGQLIGRGIPVCEFGATAESLQDAYLAAVAHARGAS